MIGESDAWEAWEHVSWRDTFSYELVQGRSDASLKEICAKAIEGDEYSCGCKSRRSIGEY